MPEHTWGADIKTFLNDTAAWENNRFRARLGDRNYRAVVAGWADQAAYVDHALDALGDSPEVRACRRPATHSRWLLSQHSHNNCLAATRCWDATRRTSPGCAPAQPAMRLTFYKKHVWGAFLLRVAELLRMLCDS